MGTPEEAAKGGEEDGEIEDEDDEADGVKLTLIDASGDIVRALDDAPAAAGLHRVVWDLGFEETTEVKLRTLPEENSHVSFSEDGWRSLTDGGRLSVVAAPGVYTVRLEARGKTMTQKLEILADPGAAGSAEDLKAQMKVVMDLRRMVSEAAEMINQIEWARKRIDDLEARLAEAPYKEHPETAEVLSAAEALDFELRELEGRFFDLRLTQAGQDSLRWKRLLYARLTYLARRIMKTGYRPTDSQMAVYRQLAEELDTYRQRFRELREREVPAFNQLLRKKDIGQVILGPVS